VTITIRDATPADATNIGALIREFQSYLRSLGDPSDFAFDAESYLRDGFGPDPAFSGFVAELDGNVAGYLLYHYGYDTDRGQRLTYVIDLYVRESVWGHGVGRAVMQAAARACTEAGGMALVWTVYKKNTIALEFYERLGAQRLTDLDLMVLPVSKPF